MLLKIVWKCFVLIFVMIHHVGLFISINRDRTSGTLRDQFTYAIYGVFLLLTTGYIVIY